MKTEQILPTKLELTKAVNSPSLSEDPNAGLRKERTAASQLFRVVLAYAVVIAWVILD